MGDWSGELGERIREWGEDEEESLNERIGFDMISAWDFTKSLLCMDHYLIVLDVACGC